MSPPRLIQRTRLNRLLKKAESAWVSGPTGAGKSTLVHAFLASSVRRFRTHHLSVRDRNPAELVARLVGLFPETAANASAFAGAGFNDPDVFARHFWVWFWSVAPVSVTLVLEDQQELGSEPAAITMIREAIAALPRDRDQRIIVTSRRPLPFELFELVREGLLAVIDHEELWFTTAEAHALARLWLGRGAARASVAERPLDLRTERALVRELTGEPALVSASLLLIARRLGWIGVGEACVLCRELETALASREKEPLAELTLATARAMLLAAQGKHEEVMAGCQKAMGLTKAHGIEVDPTPLFATAIVSAVTLGEVAEARKLSLAISARAVGSNLVEALRHHALGLLALASGDGVTARLHAMLSCEHADRTGALELQIYARALEAQALAHLGLFEASRELCEEYSDHSAAIQGAGATLRIVAASLALETKDLDRARTHLAAGLKAVGVSGLRLFPGLSRVRLAALCGLALRDGIEVEVARKLVVDLGLAPPPDGVGRLWPWALEVRALGGLLLRTPHGELDAPTGKPGELLCALVALGARDVPVSALCDRVWPDAEGDAARRSFDTALHRLRHSLPEGTFVLEGRRLGLSTKSVWVDVNVVRSLASRNQWADPEASVVELWDAYRGPLFGDESPYFWAEGARNDVAALAASAALSLVAALELEQQSGVANLVYERARLFGLFGEGKTRDSGFVPRRRTIVALMEPSDDVSRIAQRSIPKVSSQR